MSPLPDMSQFNIGPNTIALGRFGAKPVALKTRKPGKPAKVTEAEFIRAHDAPHFLSDITTAGHFLAQVHSFMLS